MNQSRRDVLKGIGAALASGAAVTMIPSEGKALKALTAEPVPPKSDEQKALDIIVKAVTSPGGYYTWSTLPQGDQWLIRIPSINATNADWMIDELVEQIHVCRPIEFVKAMKEQRKHDLALHSGYVTTTKLGRQCNRGDCKAIYKAS